MFRGLHLFERGSYRARELLKVTATTSSSLVTGLVTAAASDKIMGPSLKKRGSSPVVDPAAKKAKTNCVDSVKAIAWNVNGLRALLKKEKTLQDYIKEHSPDIFCMGETKISHDSLKEFKSLLPEYKHRYWACADKKGYSGSVVLSKLEPLKTIDAKAVWKTKHHDEGRLLALEFDRFWLVHCYVPNAGMKLERLKYRTEEWDVDLREFLRGLEKEKPVLLCGDLNVAHEEIDIHDPKRNRNKTPGFTDAERANFGELLKDGYVDTWRSANPGVVQYTYWSYRFNMRAKNKGRQAFGGRL